MAANFHRWEADPLFSAAEVVQDSADRMESIFRILVHEQSLVQGDCPDSRLLTLINYHRRDLATILETTKWQLEDFERAVSLSAVTEKSRVREDVIFRHKQFVLAIREQVIHVEKSLDDSSMGNSLSNADWVNLNEQDRDGLASFLSGGNFSKHHDCNGSEDVSTINRFIDQAPTSSFGADEIVEHTTGEIKNLNMKGMASVNHDSGLAKGKNRVGSHCSLRSGFEACETFCGRRDEVDNWDLEADEAKCKNFFPKNKLSGLLGRMNGFNYLGNFWSTYESREAISFMKKWKDGDDQRNSLNVSRTAQGNRIRMRLSSGFNSFQALYSHLFMEIMRFCSWIAAVSYRRFMYHIQVNPYSMQLILTVLLTIIILGILLSQLA